jgi:hypothetical protein
MGKHGRPTGFSKDKAQLVNLLKVCAEFREPMDKIDTAHNAENDAGETGKKSSPVSEQYSRGRNKR